MAVALSIDRERALLAQACSQAGGARERAFAALAQAVSPSLHALCLGVTGNQADAEDAVQDTLCAVAGALPSFRGEARLYTWCYQIALRAAVRIKAKNRRRAEVSEPPVDLDRSAEAMAERADRKRLLAAMMQLPIEQRVVLTMFVDGSSHEEIAEVLGVPTGTVWSRLHVGRKRLRALLDGAPV